MQDFGSLLSNSDLIKDPEADLDQQVDQYNKVLSSALDKLAPLKSMQMVSRTVQPWMNNEIRVAKQKRRKAESAWRKTQLSVHRDIYKSERSNVNKMIKNAKAEFYNKKVTQCHGDQKSLFKLVSNLLNTAPCNALTKHDSLYSLVQDFSGYFCDKITKI